MMEFLQITNDPDMARRCDALPGMRLFVDLEVHGKAARQAGRNTFISTHQPQDVGRVKAELRRSQLMVRVNPLYEGTAAELDTVLTQGADLVMLPMFQTPEELRAFSRLVAGRVPVVALLETAGALHSLDAWVDTPGLSEVFVGLNDLHLSLGCAFMFEPLASGLVDRVSARVHSQGLRFGFGGVSGSAVELVEFPEVETGVDAVVPCAGC
jgi:citrate lyase beta subunit